MSTAKFGARALGTDLIDQSLNSIYRTAIKIGKKNSLDINKNILGGFINCTP